MEAELLKAIDTIQKLYSEVNELKKRIDILTVTTQTIPPNRYGVYVTDVCDAIRTQNMKKLEALLIHPQRDVILEETKTSLICYAALNAPADFLQTLFNKVGMSLTLSDVDKAQLQKCVYEFVFSTLNLTTRLTTSTELTVSEIHKMVTHPVIGQQNLFNIQRLKNILTYLMEKNAISHDLLPKPTSYYKRNNYHTHHFTEIEQLYVSYIIETNDVTQIKTALTDPTLQFEIINQLQYITSPTVELMNCLFTWVIDQINPPTNMFKDVSMLNWIVMFQLLLKMNIRETAEYAKWSEMNKIGKNLVSVNSIWLYLLATYFNTDEINILLKSFTSQQDKPSNGVVNFDMLKETEQLNQKANQSYHTYEFYAVPNFRPVNALIIHVLMSPMAVFPICRRLLNIIEDAKWDTAAFKTHFDEYTTLATKLGLPLATVVLYPTLPNVNVKVFEYYTREFKKLFQNYGITIDYLFKDLSTLQLKIKAILELDPNSKSFVDTVLSFKSYLQICNYEKSILRYEFETYQGLTLELKSVLTCLEHTYANNLQKIDPYSSATTNTTAAHSIRMVENILNSIVYFDISRRDYLGKCWISSCPQNTSDQHISAILWQLAPELKPVNKDEFDYFVNKLTECVMSLKIMTPKTKTGLHQIFLNLQYYFGVNVTDVINYLETFNPRHGLVSI
jgi:hypothetical protein